MGRTPGVKNGQGKKAAKKAATDNPETAPREASQMTPSVQANGPTADEKRKALEEYRNHRRRLADIMKDAADERGNGRSILKAFENKGGSPKKIRQMWELTDMTRGEAEAEIAEYLGYAVDIGIRVAFDSSGQGNMVDVLNEASAPLKPTIEGEADLARSRSYSDGWNSAKAGGDVSRNPHYAGTVEHQQWAIGFGDWHWEQNNGPSPTANPTDIATGVEVELPADPV